MVILDLVKVDDLSKIMPFEKIEADAVVIRMVPPVALDVVQVVYLV